MSRNKAVWMVIGGATLFLSAQAINTCLVRKELCARLSNGAICDARTGLGSVQFLIPFITGPTAGGKEPLRVAVSTALARRTCDNRWTIGFGGRGETAESEFANGTGTLTIGRTCADLGITRRSGHATDARLSIGQCEIQLSPLQFELDGALQASVTATVDPSTAEACRRLFPQPPPELSSTIANARIELSARYGSAAVEILMSELSSSTAERGAGFVRRILSAAPTSQLLEISLGEKHASLRVDTEPAGTSAVATLSLQADAAIAAQLPDLQPPAGAPLKLEVRWNVDHDTGTVRLNGADIKRVPLVASRAAGRIDLPASECHAEGRSLFFVEADDEGQPLQSAQLDGVFTAVDDAVARAGALVAVFVHGWHHSAAPGDDYVCRLSDLLDSVEQMELGAATRAGRPPRDVMGVYVGWAGAMYPNELANSVTTFWNRLAAADRLGAKDGVLQRLFAGLSPRLAGARAGTRADHRSSLLVVGHSMGARAVFSALRDDLLRTDASTPTGLQADLGLLINPAFSATQFRAVDQRSRDCQAETTPLLLFSSETDGVTRQLYPAGQTMTFSSTDAVPFLEHIYTAANFAEFVTHRLTLEVIHGDPPDVEGPQTILRGFERTPAGTNELYEDNPVTVYRQPLTGRPSAADAWYRMRLEEAGSRAASCRGEAKTSKVIAVDPRILPDHGRIFTPPFVEYVVRVLNHRALDASGVR